MFNPEEVELPFQTQEIVVRGRGLWVPYLNIETVDGEQHILHWGNTTVRQFEEEEYDHVELKIGERVCGMVFDDDMMDKFIDYDYPLKWLPLVDDATLEWFISREADHIDDELGDFFNES